MDRILSTCMILGGLCYLALIPRLYALGILKRYRCLALYLFVEGGGDLLFAMLSPSAPGYVRWYFGITPVLWVSAYLAVLELCRLILEDYPGIAGAGRKLVAWTMGVALLAAGTVAATVIAASPTKNAPLQILLVLHISVRAGLLLFLVLIQFFVRRFRLDLPLNRRVLALGYAACWALDVITDVVSQNAGYRTSEITEAAQMVACSAMLIVGMILLRADGEQTREKSAAGGEATAQLHRKLAEMNRLLSEAGRTLKATDKGSEKD